MKRYNFRPRPTQTSTTEALFRSSTLGQVAEDPGLTTPWVSRLATGFNYCNLDWGLPWGLPGWSCPGVHFQIRFRSHAGQRCLSGFDLSKGMCTWPSCWSRTRLGHGNKGRRLELPHKSTSAHAAHLGLYIRRVYSTCYRSSSGQQHHGHQV